MKQYVIIGVTMLLLAGCEKKIDLNLKDKSGTIVIEGNVTNQVGPYYVRITKSVAFTEANQYPPITDALVTISDNTGAIDTLQYVTNGRYKTTRLVASPGHTYTLRVFTGGNNFTAQSTMPQPVALDNLKQDSFVFGPDTSYSILPIFTDPVQLGNRYLFIVSVNSNKEKSLQTFSDNINNGLVNQRNLLLPMNDDEDVKIGDTIHVEMQCVDLNIYTFYAAVNDISDGGGPGGGVTPSNPPGNISNAALGYFSAHSTTVSSMVIR